MTDTDARLIERLRGRPGDQASARALRAEAAARIESLTAHAEFLCARLRDLEGYDGDELLRQIMGHVYPALTRMEAALGDSK
jgi:hypothetical protein